MKYGLTLALCALPLLAGCGGGGGNDSANQANVAAEEGGDLNVAISGDELSPIPEAEDDMIANNAAAANAAVPAPANAAAPAPAPAPAQPPR